MQGIGIVAPEAKSLSFVLCKACTGKKPQSATCLFTQCERCKHQVEFVVFKCAPCAELTHTCQLCGKATESPAGELVSLKEWMLAQAKDQGCEDDLEGWLSQYADAVTSGYGERSEQEEAEFIALAKTTTLGLGETDLIRRALTEGEPTFNEKTIAITIGQLITDMREQQASASTASQRSPAPNAKSKFVLLDEANRNPRTSPLATPAGKKIACKTESQVAKNRQAKPAAKRRRKTR